MSGDEIKGVFYLEGRLWKAHCYARLMLVDVSALLPYNVLNLGL